MKLVVALVGMLALALVYGLVNSIWKGVGCDSRISSVIFLILAIGCVVGIVIVQNKIDEYL